MVPLGRGIRGKIGELGVITDYRRLANALGLAAPQREGGVRGGLTVGKLESFRVSPLDYSCLILIVTPPLRLTQQLTYMLPDAYYAHWVCTVGLPADCACGLAFSDEHLHDAQNYVFSPLRINRKLLDAAVFARGLQLRIASHFRVRISKLLGSALYL